MKRESKPRPHKPNAVPATQRYANILMGVVLVAYGVLGLVSYRMDLSGRRIRIAVLEGGPAWPMGAAFLVGAAVLFAVVVDHYDKRDNERFYRAFRWAASRLGWCLAGSALVAHLYLAFTK